MYVWHCILKETKHSANARIVILLVSLKKEENHCKVQLQGVAEVHELLDISMSG